MPWKNAMGGVAPLKFSCRVYRRGAQRQSGPSFCADGAGAVCALAAGAMIH
ncbi:hypothetical protein MRBBS_2636 [Marinobacter sp. BSs20148]|nr:hypothetical protein MRBBS_2636 [Marinobacter sp. BSs20148]